MKYKVLLSILLITSVLKGLGQSYEVYKRSIDVPKELENVNFSGGLQDQIGFIWLTNTKGNLIRFDNHCFKTYGTHNGVPVGGASNLYLDSEGMIVIHVKWYDHNEQTIALFDPVLEKTYSLEEYLGQSIPFNVSNTTRITQNSDGSIWIQIDDGTIFELKNRQLSLWGQTKINGGFNGLYKSANGLAYISTYSSSESIHISNRNGEEKEIAIPKGYLFKGFLEFINSQTYPTGVFLQLKNIDKVTTELSYCDGNGISFLDFNSAIANYHTINQKIGIFSQNRGVLMDHNMDTLAVWDQPSEEKILFFDQQGGWWTTNKRGELNRRWVKENRFKVFKNSWGDAAMQYWHQSVRGIYADQHDVVYLAQGGALAKNFPDRETQFFITYSDFYGIRHEQGTSNLWVASGPKVSVFNMQKKQFEKSYPLGNGLSSALQTYEDRYGQIWCGCSFGIAIWNDKENEFTRFTGYPGYELFDRARIFHFYENDKGMWVATGEGLFLLDSEAKTIERFYNGGDRNHYLPNNVIAHLQEDLDGSFWLASKGGGLIHWFPESGDFEQFTVANGLKNDVVYACYQDDFNQLWLPSDNGLMRFDKSTKEIIHYTTNDGIPEQEFNTMAHHEDSLGRLYFGGLNGAISFHPKDFVPKPNPFRLHISSYQKTNMQDLVSDEGMNSVVKNHKVSIESNDKEILIKFALLNFEETTERDFEYKLEGLHANWIPLKTPEVSLRGIPYGTYKLRFRCRMHGYSWKEYENAITVKVPPPFYLRWWFIALVILSFVFSVWFFIRWRLSAAKKRERELENQVAIRTKEISAQAEELKSLDKMKTQFFANISHELRTPLTLILGPVKEMKSKKNNDLSTFQLQHNLDVINRNAEKLLGLVEEVLDLAKLDAGKLLLEEEPTSLIEFTRYIKSGFETIAELNNIQYFLNYKISAKNNYHIDQGKVSTILTNFLSNAFKFCGENGEITLAVEEKKFTLLFKVIDTGIGIKEENLDTIFNRFYQVKASGKTAHGGTGIGLSLCRELAKLMGGKVWAESVYKKGSTFYFELPKKEAISDQTNSLKNKPAINSDVLPNKTKVSLEQPTILLVEDNLDMSQFIQSLLTPEYNIITGKNGLEGLQALETQAENIDLIISDVMMPGMDGFTMLEQIKQDERWFNIPIIMLTARASEGDKLHALTIGADDYLIKPFSREELLVRIQNLLANYQHRKLWKTSLTDAVQSISDKKTKLKQHLDKEKKNEISKKDLEWLKRVELYIQEELMNDAFDIQQLSEKMFLSKRQFERKIKLLTGLTPAKLVTEIRLTKGRKLLENGDYSTVAEVSFAVGIQTPGYFSKIYTKRFGRKPSSYFQ